MGQNTRLSRADTGRLAVAAPIRVHGKLFSLMADTLPRPASSKWTCVVSKSVAAQAHDRNRLKRVCREAARTEIGRAEIPVAAMFRAKKAAREASFKDIRADIQFLIEKISARERQLR